MLEEVIGTIWTGKMTQSTTGLPLCGAMKVTSRNVLLKTQHLRQVKRMEGSHAVKNNLFIYT